MDPWDWHILCSSESLQNSRVAEEVHLFLLISSGFLGSYLALKNASFGDTSLNVTYAAYTYHASCGVVGKCACRRHLASADQNLPI
jgi:hypothetical protein